jgi:hypothetical protein
MEELGLLKKLEKVKAPPNFEQIVMARVSLRKKSVGRRPAALRLSLAGAFATLVIAFVLLNVFVLQKKGPVGVSDMKKGVPPAAEMVQSAAGRIVPVIETLDYSTEVRSRSNGAKTIYLLEQVSDTTSQEILY